MITPTLHHMTEEEYHAKAALGSSGLRRFAHPQFGPSRYKQQFARGTDADNSRPLQLGTAVHAAVLEPRKFSQLCELKSRQDQSTDNNRFKAYSSFFPEMRTPKLAIDSTVIEVAAAMAPIVSRMWDQFSHVEEVPIFWTENGVACKAKPDSWIQTAEMTCVLDLKTTMRIDRWMPRSNGVFYPPFDYIMQAAHYAVPVLAMVQLDAAELSLAELEERFAFAFIVCNTKAPEETVVCNVPADQIHEALHRRRELIDEFGRRLASDDWSNRAEVIE